MTIDPNELSLNELADQNCALTEEQLDAVTGGRDFAAAQQHFKDARQDFARGDIAGGLAALAAGNAALK